MTLDVVIENYFLYNIRGYLSDYEPGSSTSSILKINREIEWFDSYKDIIEGGYKKEIVCVDKSTSRIYWWNDNVLMELSPVEARIIENDVLEIV